jgi:hypothetical protein
MTEQVITAKCSVCKTIKPITEFHKRSDRPSGHKSECKKCFYILHVNTDKSHLRAKIYRNTERGKELRKITHQRYLVSEKGRISQRKSANKYRVDNPEKRRAQSVVFNAVEQKRISPAKAYHCRICWKQARDYHHHLGYSPEHWFDVTPLCRMCHSSIHNINLYGQGQQ